MELAGGAPDMIWVPDEGLCSDDGGGGTVRGVAAEPGGVTRPDGEIDAMGGDAEGAKLVVASEEAGGTRAVGLLGTGTGEDDRTGLSAGGEPAGCESKVVTIVCGGVGIEGSVSEALPPELGTEDDEWLGPVPGMDDCKGTEPESDINGTEGAVPDPGPDGCGELEPEGETNG